MPFSQTMISGLVGTEACEKAEFFNSLDIGVGKRPADVQELKPLNSKIATLASSPQLKQLVENITIGNQPLSSTLSDVISNVEYGSQLEAMIEVLSSQPQTKPLSKLIETLEDYQQAYAQFQKSQYRAKGLYGCLMVVDLALSQNKFSASTEAFQNALLMGVVVPNLRLFEQMEEAGDLTLEDEAAIHEAKLNLAQMMQQFKNQHKQSIEKSIAEQRKIQEQQLAIGFEAQTKQLQALEEALATLQQSYRQNYQNLAPDEKEAIEQEITELSTEISGYHKKLDPIKEKHKAFIDKRMAMIEKKYQEEDVVLDNVFSNVNNELDFILRRAKALDKKKQLNQQYPNRKDKKQQKKRRKALDSAKEETGFWYLLSDNTATDNKKMIEKYGGRLLVNQSQGRLAAMGHSDGLCGGYSAEFLLACMSPGWDNLPIEQKMARLRNIVNPNQSFKLDDSANITVNDLFMTLESGLRWDIQSKLYSNEATVFEIKEDDKSHATHKRKSRNQKAFFKKYVQGIMNATNGPEAKQLMLTFFDKNEGHAVGLAKDQGGYLFHDSNVGYMHFADPQKFEKFLSDYLVHKYSELTVHAHVYDFGVINQNLNQYNLQPTIPQKSQYFDLEAAGVAPVDDSKILKRMNATRIQLEQVQIKIERASVDLESEPVNEPEEGLEGQASLSRSSSSEYLSLEPETLESSGTDEVVITAEEALTSENALSEEAEPSQRQSALTSSYQQSTRVSTEQAHLKHRATRNEHLASLIEAYIDNCDESLNDKQVLKQRVFIELNSIKHAKDDVKLQALNKLCEAHHLPKCAKLLEEVEQAYKSTPKVKLNK